MTKPIRAIYQAACGAGEIESLAKFTAIEQTVEVPEAVFYASRSPRDTMGTVASITPVDGQENKFRYEVEYRADLAHGQLPQLLNLLYGNITLDRRVKLIDFELPPEVMSIFQGPKFGCEGIRKLTGVYGRPLLCTALKPRGAPVEDLAKIGRDFALGGGDLVKDDHNLADDSFADFKNRVTQCHDAVEEANQKTGRNTLYFVNLFAPAERVFEYVDFLADKKIPGFMVCPSILGLDTTRALAARANLVVLSHPSMTGINFSNPNHGISPGLLYGRFFRLIGVDISVFVNYGGRFDFSKQDAEDICRELQQPLGNLKPAFPAPAGGMKFENVPQMAQMFGQETIYLVGGALIGHSNDLSKSTAQMLDLIREHFSERLEKPVSIDRK